MNKLSVSKACTVILISIIMSTHCFAGIKTMIETIENRNFTVKIKNLGAELTNIKSKTTNIEYLWQGKADIWSGQSPLLFPFVGRLNKGQYKLNGQIYKMSKHGFAMNKQFKTIEKSKDSVTMLLTDDVETIKIYPYKFSLKVKYTLKGQTLSVSYIIENQNDETMYFSIGGHPAFNCPIANKGQLNDYRLQFEHKETANCWKLQDETLSKIIENYLDNTNAIQLTEETFNDDALIFKHLKSDSIKIVSDKTNHYVKVDFPKFQHLGIWSKPGPSGYVCIEPWFGHDDNKGFAEDISKKEGIQSIEPKKTFKAKFKITCK